VFAAHAAIALRAAREHERVEELEDDLRGSRQESRQYDRQAEVAVALQRSMLTELPDLAPLQVAARYVPATEAVEVGGDWYDAFRLPGGATALVVGDLAGHDLPAAVSMGQARNVLRALAIDRQELPGRILARLDAVLSHLEIGQTASCVYAQLDARHGAWRALLANAGHPPPLLCSSPTMRRAIWSTARSRCWAPDSTRPGRPDHHRHAAASLDAAPLHRRAD
jgi:serine phosphatase RsbU (regulator of sigma subunit)